MSDASIIDQRLEDVLDRSLTSEELEDLTERDPEVVATTFSSQDFDVAGLVNRLNRGSMVIPSFGVDDKDVSTAGFQRGFVWTKKQMDRFVESLLMGFPVPGIFLVRQSENNLQLVLDGQQRLETLRRFYEGTHAGRVFALDNVSDEFKGLTYKTLNESLRIKLDDSYLQATIVRSNGSTAVNESVYQIFERLNAGGTQLTPHEIRVALYAGPLIAYLDSLNQSADWRALFGRPSARIRDQELVLRVLSLYVESEVYQRPLKSFLNSFAGRHRQADAPIQAAGALFLQACSTLADQVGPRALRRPGVSQVNVAQAEAVLVACMRGLEHGDLRRDMPDALTDLLSDDGFKTATTRSTADNDAVSARLSLASQALRK